MPVDLRDLPTELGDVLAGADLVPITVGRSGSVVARADRSGAAALVLKLVEMGSGAPPLTEEIARLEWLQGRWPVPELVAHGGDDRATWMVTTSLAGHDATRSPLAGQPEVLARRLGEVLRDLHDRGPVDDCPFDGRAAALVDHARRQVEAGLVDPADFQPIHQGLTPQELLAHVVDRQPADPPDLVLTHGDYCLPNVVLADDGRAGVVDLGLVGVGDRYRDLAIGARSVVANLGPAAVGPFFDAYGIEFPDLARVDAFIMIDELF